MPTTGAGFGVHPDLTFPAPHSAPPDMATVFKWIAQIYSVLGSLLAMNRHRILTSSRYMFLKRNILYIHYEHFGPPKEKTSMKTPIHLTAEEA